MCHRLSRRREYFNHRKSKKKNEEKNAIEIEDSAFTRVFWITLVK